MSVIYRRLSLNSTMAISRANTKVNSVDKRFDILKANFSDGHVCEHFWHLV